MKKKNVLFQICLTLGMVGFLSFQAYAQTVPASVSGNPVTTSNTQTAVGPFDPISTRILSDPLFLPLKGQIYGTTAYTFSDLRYNGFDAGSGVKNYNERDFIDTLSQNLAYGITNDLTVQITESYSWERDESTTSTSSTKDTSNPTLGATYRVLDQSVYPVDVDFSGSYTPNFDINGGHTASGLHMASLTGSVGREMKAFTVQLTGSAQYYGVEKDTSLDERVGPYWWYSLGLNTQTRLTDRFSVNCGFSYYFPDVQKYHLTDGVAKQAWGSEMSIDTAFNYQIIPNKLVASITYSYLPSMSVKEKYSNSSYNENINGLYGNTVGARLQYLF